MQFPDTDCTSECRDCCPDDVPNPAEGRPWLYRGFGSSKPSPRQSFSHPPSVIAIRVLYCCPPTTFLAEGAAVRVWLAIGHECGSALSTDSHARRSAQGVHGQPDHSSEQAICGKLHPLRYGIQNNSDSSDVDQVSEINTEAMETRGYIEESRQASFVQGPLHCERIQT